MTELLVKKWIGRKREKKPTGRTDRNRKTKQEQQRKVEKAGAEDS
jgi:hypothetical protein